MTTRTPGRTAGATSSLLISGAVLLMAANIAHPLDADPTPVSRLVFATEPTWIPIHLALALGFLLLTAGLVAVGRRIQDTHLTASSHVATIAALLGGGALVMVFGALDGYATSALATSEADAATIGAAAIAEEAIDSGLAGLGTLLFFGLAIGALGLSISNHGRLQRWIGWSAVVIGAAGTSAGTALLVEGPTTFTINVMLRPVAVAGTLWFLALGISLRRRGITLDALGRAAGDPAGTAVT